MSDRNDAVLSRECRISIGSLVPETYACTAELVIVLWLDHYFYVSTYWISSGIDSVMKQLPANRINKQTNKHHIYIGSS